MPSPVTPPGGSGGRQRAAAGEAVPASPTGVQRVGAGGCPAEPPPCPLPGTAGWGQGAFRAACLRFCLPEEVPLPPDLPGRTGWGLKGNRAFYFLLLLLNNHSQKRVSPLAALPGFCCDLEGSGAPGCSVPESV